MNFTFLRGRLNALERVPRSPDGAVVAAAAAPGGDEPMTAERDVKGALHVRAEAKPAAE